jgi:hypothetical protein
MKYFEQPHYILYVARVGGYPDFVKQTRENGKKKMCWPNKKRRLKNPRRKNTGKKFLTPRRYVACEWRARRETTNLLHVFVCAERHDGSQEEERVESAVSAMSAKALDEKCGSTYVPASADAVPATPEAACESLGLGSDSCVKRKSCQYLHRPPNCEQAESVHTVRLSLPTRSPSKISRASSEWPTSSKESVASCPATSIRTSSPPLMEDVSAASSACCRPRARVFGRNEGGGDTHGCSSTKLAHEYTLSWITM